MFSGVGLDHWILRLSRGLVWLWTTCAFVAAAPQSQQSAGSAPESLRAPINQYCVGCHNDKVKTAGLTLNGVDLANVQQNPDVWEKVVRKLRARYMPPVGLPRPDEQTYSAIVSYLDKSLDAAAAAHPNPGRTDTFHRLNRTEYHNAIRDLLNVESDVASLLPSDDSSYGFDNITAGELSPTLLERYLNAAQKISRLAVGSPVRTPTGDTILLPADFTQEEHVDKLPFGTRGGTVVDYTFPLDAEYRIQIRLSRDRNEQVEGLAEDHQVELMLDGERIQVFTATPPPAGESHDAVDKDFYIRIPVKAGPHALAVAFLKKPSVLLETKRQPYQAHFNLDRHPRVQPALYSITVLGPYNANGAGDTPSRRQIFVCNPAAQTEEEDCAKRIISTLTRRAYRRSTTDADTRAVLRFYKDARAAGGGFEAGIERALRAVLISPEFLFRVEQDPANLAPNTPYQLSQLELASRLSFFLWSSIPDNQLLDLAVAEKLKDPAVLQQQIRRMLADKRSDALVTSFADQWLYLRNLSSIIPDPRLFPDFDDNLRQSMRRETELFFESVLREDRSVLDLLRARYSFINERLAKHYEIPNIYGSQFRRITFDRDSVRGGLLGQGSILTVSSYPDRTSPVMRGKWILANIVGSPPPPPPPNVPPLKDSAAAGRVLTMRERLAEHRANQPCAGCHKLMDPVGFSLENLDATGRWRSKDEGAPVDASGNLPDGGQFSGVAGLREALLKRPELFVTTTTEKLLTYAVGRGLETYDAAAVREIVSEARSEDYRLSSLILGIVKSKPFQMRRSQ